MRHVVEARGPRTGLESTSDLGAQVTGERGDDRGLARTGLAEQPNDKRISLRALARGLGASTARSAGAAEQQIANRGPEPVEHSHDVPQTLRQRASASVWEASLFGEMR